ncbi:DUF1893 domain-containing protein [Clostridiaceae bacterium M8S5]|nr:DUF1893 domain-containing protein [Clostridiaceae bacterium M8S5]
MSIIVSQQLELLNKYPKKTCFVLLEDKIIYSSQAKGVKPLKDYYEQFGCSNKPIIVVDRIMGKGAVMLADLIGAKEINTPIISQIALEYANAHRINTHYIKIVPYIINRAGDGRCPIETAVSEIDNAKNGYDVIDMTLKSLVK